MTRRLIFHSFWRFILILLFVFVFFHFLKDITQDVLKIQSPLDLLGNVSEDLSVLPHWLRGLFPAFAYLSFFAETYLLIAILIVTKNDEVFSKLDLSILCVSILLLVYLAACTFLDPRFNPFMVIKGPNNLPQISNIAKRPLIISTDNAATSRIIKSFALEQDDALALAVLLQAHKRGELRIIGITSTFGNTDGDTVYSVTKKQIDLSRLNIPVFKGASFPGQTDSPAVDFITKTLENSPEKVTLVALGPVTDYAAVFRKHPELKEKVENFFLIRSGPYLNKNRWYLFSFNAVQDMESAIFLYKLGGNQFSIGKEIFGVSVDEVMIRDMRSVNNPMIQFISKDLSLWNIENKLFFSKGYLSRKGDMCPWDLVWSTYLTNPDLYSVQPEGNHYILHLKDISVFKEKVVDRLKDWEGIN